MIFCAVRSRLAPAPAGGAPNLGGSP
uniref:Uncharacterized protein n=1 Tax=Arundo donax TaxID=35708 RepID=A0A0A9FXN0_ARUDO